MILALGLGANTAIFTFVNAALLKPLPYPGAEAIVALNEIDPKSGAETLVHPRSYVEWRDRARSFEALAIAQAIPINVEGPDGPEQVAGLWTTPEIFRVFGVEPAQGRAFAAAEKDVAVLSYEYWKSRLGSDAGIVGRTVRMGRSAVTVIGIMPPGFRVGTLSIDIFTPMPLERNRPEAVGSRSFLCFGRLRQGVAPAAAQAEMSVLAPRVGREYEIAKDWRVKVSTLRDFLVKDNRAALTVLLALVGAVLLIACANLAGLLLARGVSRRHEFAVRISLGAGRGQLLRQLLVESLALSAAGGALGIVLGGWASRALVYLARDAVAFGQMTDVHVDARVMGFAIGLTLLTALVFGLVPAWQASRVEFLQRQQRDARRLRAVLVAGEVALAAVLLVGSGLLLRTFTNLLDVRLGFQPEQALTMRLFVLGDPARRANFVEDVLARVTKLPQVQAAGTIQFLPLGGWTNRGPFHFVGESRTQDMDTSTVSHGYFEAMGIPVLRGRAFTPADRIGSPRVALVNETFVRLYMRGEDPIGKRISGDWASTAPAEIVGVAGDIRHDALTERPRPTAFLAQAQSPGYFTYLIVRTVAAPEAMATAIRREVRQVDPTEALTAIFPMEHYVSTALARPRLYAVLTGAFSLLALALAAVGLYGLMAYAVSRRTHEIGIRMALGAGSGAILRSMLGQGLRLVAGGLAIGLAGALAVSRLLGAYLYGVGARDPLTYVGVAAVLGLAAMAATLIPARRAAHVQPMAALRHE